VSGEWSFDFNPRPPGAPLAVWADLVVSMADALEQAGYVATYRDETGLGVVWVTPREPNHTASG
jgi:hypothetical protein